MPVDFSDILVIGVSSRALFDLEKENEIFDSKGIEGFRKFQQENENEPLGHGTAFYLVKSLLELNNQANKRIVEVVVMSRNSPETGVRMLNSIKNQKLDITRVALSGGDPIVYKSGDDLATEGQSHIVGAGLIAFYVLLAIAAITMIFSGVKKVISK